MSQTQKGKKTEDMGQKQKYGPPGPGKQGQGKENPRKVAGNGMKDGGRDHGTGTGERDKSTWGAGMQKGRGQRKRDDKT